MLYKRKIPILKKTISNADIPSVTPTFFLASVLPRPWAPATSMMQHFLPLWTCYMHPCPSSRCSFCLECFPSLQPFCLLNSYSSIKTLLKYFLLWEPLWMPSQIWDSHYPSLLNSLCRPLSWSLRGDCLFICGAVPAAVLHPLPVLLTYAAFAS